MMKKENTKINLLDILSGYEKLLLKYEQKVNPEDNHIFARIEAAITGEEILDAAKLFVEETKAIKDLVKEEKDSVFNDLIVNVDGFKGHVKWSLGFDNRNLDELLEEVNELITKHVSIEAAKIDSIDFIDGALMEEYGNANEHAEEFSDIEDTYIGTELVKNREGIYEIDISQLNKNRSKVDEEALKRLLDIEEKTGQPIETEEVVKFKSDEQQIDELEDDKE
ncbi:MAG: hypothetical protein N4A47_00735 [Clostridia bacterium]|jgi:hypothetical protein|nr:hypothetical protein [Clostridia bacterium]